MATRTGVWRQTFYGASEEFDLFAFAFNFFMSSVFAREQKQINLWACKLVPPSVRAIDSFYFKLSSGFTTVMCVESFGLAMYLFTSLLT